MDPGKTIAVFVITSLWDVVLRWVATGYLPLAGLEEMKWIVVLKDYFERHTVLGAALIAGFVGAVTEICLHHTVNRWFPPQSALFVAGVILVSGLIGLPMRYSGLFPHLEQYYYKPLGFWYSFATDAFSGFVVMMTFWSLKKILR